MTPTQRMPNDPKLADVLDIIRSNFAYMDGRIDPPTSMHRLTLAHLSEQAKTDEVWSFGDPIAACMILTPKPRALYIGKMAISQQHRGKGLARQLIDTAKSRAAAYDLPCLELESRVELTDLHSRFAALGFGQTGTTTHAGYDRPTSIVMQLALNRD